MELGLAIAVLLLLYILAVLRYQRKWLAEMCNNVLNSTADKLGETDAKLDSLAEEISKLSRNLKEMSDVRASMKASVETENAASSAPQAKPDFYVNPLRSGQYYGIDAEGAVDVAIKETGASSLNDMGIVIKAARAHLKNAGRRFDEGELSDLVRSRLEAKTKYI